MSRSLPLFLLALVAGCDATTPDDTSSERWTPTPDDLTATPLGADARPLVRASGAFLAEVADDHAVIDAEGVYVERSGLSVRLTAWGRDGALHPVGATHPHEGACADLSEDTDCVRRVELDRGGITEWWFARPSGLEQGFDVAAAPAGEGALTVWLDVDGIDAITVEPDHVSLLDTAGTSWTVRGLQAWDATGAPLAVAFALSEHGYAITVDDTSATYPVTIDPLLTTVWWSDASAAAGAMSGDAVASGDIDGDGDDDLVVGKPGIGKIGIWRGSSSGLTGWRAWSHDTTSGWGTALEVCDVNGDGHADVVAGAPYDDDGGTDAGAVVVFWGPTLDTFTSKQGPAAYAHYGKALDCGSIGSADAYADLIVGAPGYDDGATDTGRACVIKGASSGFGTESCHTPTTRVRSCFLGICDTKTTRYPYANCGTAVAAIGSYDGDGDDDFAIGCPTANRNATDDGMVAIYDGGGQSWVRTIIGASAGDQMGFALAGGGHLNGDAYKDFVVGQPYDDVGSAVDAGSVTVFYGAASGTFTSTTYTADTFGYDRLGWTVAILGDIDLAGGIDDVAFASPYNYYSRGKAWLIRNGSTTATAIGTGPANGAEYGAAITGGDVNGDGVPDAIIGAPYHDTSSGADAGYVDVHLGSVD